MRAVTEVNVSFKLHEARRLAAEVLAYLHAWDVYRMMTFQQLAGQPPAYPLAPATGKPVKSGPAPAKENGALHSMAAAQPQAVTSGIARPLTRKGKTPVSNGVSVKTTTQPEAAVAAMTADQGGEARSGLRYGDGLALNGNNATEAQAFQRYVAEHEKPPASKAILQAYYRQHMLA